MLKPIGIVTAVLAVGCLLWAGLRMMEMSRIDGRITEMRQDIETNPRQLAGEELERHILSQTENMESNLSFYRSVKSGRNLLGLIGLALGVVAAVCLRKAGRQSPSPAAEA
ncbi:MAG: hypothetical protein AAGD11_07045 [Planctomycetota bacterium]